MTRLDKLIQKILKGNTLISMDETIKVLTSLGYEAQKQNSGTSHITYKKTNSRITLVLNRKELKNYQLNELQAILKKEGF